MKLDWAMLRTQKQLLLDLAQGGRTSLAESELLSGLVCLLDYIQDKAVDLGESTELEVFGPPMPEWLG